MARTQIKLLLFLITLGIVVGCFATALWIYQNVLLPEKQTQADIKQMQAPGRPPPDPGARRFENAVDQVRDAKLSEAREALYKLLQQFPKSSTCDEAKRILGEMNMDALCSLDTAGGKKDYIVQPHDALAAIASRNHTSLEAIARFNSLTTYNLQPGEHLFLIPLDFDMVLSASTGKLTLLQDGLFFKEYQALKVVLNAGTKVPSEMSIGNKSAILGSKTIAPVSADFMKAEKTIVAYKGPVTVGLVIHAPPRPEPAGQTTSTAPLAPPPGSKSKTKDKSSPSPAPKSKAKSKGKGKAAQQGTDDDDSPGAAAVQTGLILASEDLEEIYPILRKGSKLRIVH
ncbi:MAG: hypothetical protein JWO94_3748 [Verrucomicrobiaceae bacterium]|nr:hypothetical protein [Verrucomicrobiaceae bacterium]